MQVGLTGGNLKPGSMQRKGKAVQPEPVIYIYYTSIFILIDKESVSNCFNSRHNIMKVYNDYITTI